MATVAGPRSTTYKTAGWLKVHLHVDDSVLLRLVALKQVRVQETSMFPRYCVEDVRTYLKKDHRDVGEMDSTEQE
jgi:hypothetical protein